MRESVRRAGERFLVGFDGKAASADVKHLIRDLGVGGVVLFARNVDGPEQVADLVRELQGVARDSGHALPLAIAVDQEGGRVQRLRAPWTVWPPLRAVGRLGSEDHARRMGAALAAELAACGIRWNLAPVLDVDTNPKNPVIGDRSFGDDPDLVGRLGAALIEGLQGAGVAASAKHFPGHGDTSLDSHTDLPSVEHGRSRLDDVELRPFRKAVAAGVASITTAHVLYPEIDATLPATFSPRILGDILRGELGYDGVVLTDDMEMKAIAAGWRPGDAAARAAAAGCDVISVCKTAEVQVDAIEGVVRALESEQIPWRSADDAARRIRGLKERYLLPYADPDPRRARAAAGAGERVALAREIAERAG